ncbi:hypothetical protein ACTFIY_002713, partial [Dictyostelium cf. discoideum]
YMILEKIIHMMIMINMVLKL